MSVSICFSRSLRKDLGAFVDWSVKASICCIAREVERER